jgi:D-alanyl-D-alanine carboxypeptidase
VTQQLLDELATSQGLGATVLGPGVGWSGGVEGSFRIASITKVFVAAAVLRLHEDALIDLDAAATPLLPRDLSDPLQDAGFDPTVLQLLAHTSGLPDHSSAVEFVQAVQSEPARHWTPREQLELALSQARPDSWAYSDTGYVLLGSVLSTVTGQSLPAAVRRLVVEPAGLRHTWWEVGDRVPEGAPPRIDQLVGSDHLASFDPSVDLYGGGGLLSTTRDLALFGQALMSGRVLTTSLELMKRPGGAAQEGLGLFQLGPGLWGHTGFWGTAMGTTDDGQWSAAFVGTQAPAFGGLDPTPLPARFIEAWRSP